jgi:hypothetical protein
LPWDIENYHITDGRILNVEISIPLMEFLYTNIDDVRTAWVEMLGQFVAEEPGVEMSWEMCPRNEMAVVTIRIAKRGTLEPFTDSERKGALGAVDALFGEREQKKPAPKSSKKSTPKAKTKSKPKKKK